MKPILVCTPTWNKSHFLERTLSNLAVTADPALYRHIVVDNGSTDDTRRVCARFGVERAHNLDNVGIAQALNQCVPMLEPGQCFMKLDDDLIFFDAGWMRAMLRVLAGEPSVGGVAVPRLGREADQLCGPVVASTGPWVVDSGESWWTNAALYRYEAMRDLGSFYQPGLYGYEDVLTGVRLRALGWRTVYLASYRVRHEGEWEDSREDRQYREWKLTNRTRTNVKTLVSKFQSGARAAHIPLEAARVD